jgi:hypothetical protein
MDANEMLDALAANDAAEAAVRRFEIFTLSDDRDASVDSVGIHVCLFVMQSEALCGADGERDETWFVTGERELLDTMTCDECRAAWKAGDEESAWLAELERSYAQDR